MKTIEKKQKKTGQEYFQVTPDLWGMRILFVNVYMVVDHVNESWVLIDAGLKGSENKIIQMAQDLFGKDNPPSAIILTHGHFDHVGALEELLKTWNVPVYAHSLEHPYLTGFSSYPPPDPTAGGGLMSLMSWAYPTDPIDISSNLHALENGNVPILKEWEYIHTPGHSPGHISLFRKRGNILIAGDAFVTTKQESILSVLFQEKIISGPPRYYTTNWAKAYNSVRTLSRLKPEVAATGHGVPFYGKELRKGIRHLEEHFYSESVPKEGRYVSEPSQEDEYGVTYVPPLNLKTIVKIGLWVGVSIFSTAFFVLNRKNILRLFTEKNLGSQIKSKTKELLPVKTLGKKLSKVKLL
ncbi:MAG: MBL fold metallo-hydrolase [Bacteroidetes bacterium]|nr:MBL fold metallo-hydrolase [Bacteroidota bacterium]HET6245193.1 MBL fold metallo-hydrolase [Bacteroidia bacterium]